MPISFGYAVEFGIQGCDNFNDWEWMRDQLQNRAHGEIIRYAPSGAWFISTHPNGTGHPASHTTEIGIHVRSSDGLVISEHRFIKFVGPNHFLASDKHSRLLLVNFCGDKTPVTSREVAVSPNGRLAAIDSTLHTVAVWESIESYSDSSPPSALITCLKYDGDIHDATALRWIGDSLLVVEQRPRSGLGGVTVFVICVSRNEVLHVFENHRVVGSLSGESVALSSDTGKRAILIFANSDIFGITAVDIALRANEFLSDASPDGRYILVTTSPRFPPGAWPETRLSLTNRPTRVLENIHGANRFRGWVRCDCAPDH